MRHPSALVGGIRAVKQQIVVVPAKSLLTTTSSHTHLPPRYNNSHAQILGAFLSSAGGRPFAASFSTASTGESGATSPSAAAAFTAATVAASSNAQDAASSVPSSSDRPAAAPGAIASTSTTGSADALGPMVLATGVYVLPHPDKMAKGGEDWYFISSTKRAAGVADGVGGWAQVGVDAGAYARELMGNASVSLDEQTDANAEPHSFELDPQAALEAAHAKTTVRGSSTACVMAVNGNKLVASNLGDSGFLVIRAGAVMFQTPQQQHGFNFPFQIGSKDSNSDQPRMAQRYNLDIQPGDIIVLGTDGLWDNCFNEEIISVINYCMQGSMDASKTAQVLAHYARHRAADTKFASPFAYSAFQYGLSYLGGKMDDITVLVAFVQQANSKM